MLWGVFLFVLFTVVVAILVFVCLFSGRAQIFQSLQMPLLFPRSIQREDRYCFLYLLPVFFSLFQLNMFGDAASFLFWGPVCYAFLWAYKQILNINNHPRNVQLKSLSKMMCWRTHDISGKLLLRPITAATDWTTIQRKYKSCHLSDRVQLHLNSVKIRAEMCFLSNLVSSIDCQLFHRTVTYSNACKGVVIIYMFL